MLRIPASKARRVAVRSAYVERSPNHVKMIESRVSKGNGKTRRPARFRNLPQFTIRRNRRADRENAKRGLQPLPRDSYNESRRDRGDRPFRRLMENPS